MKVAMSHLSHPNGFQFHTVRSYADSQLIIFLHLVIFFFAPYRTPAKMTESSVKTYSLAEIASHNNSTSSWIIIHNNIYDVTAFLNEVRIAKHTPFQTSKEISRAERPSHSGQCANDIHGRVGGRRVRVNVCATSETTSARAKHVFRLTMFFSFCLSKSNSFRFKVTVSTAQGQINQAIQ